MSDGAEAPRGLAIESYTVEPASTGPSPELAALGDTLPGTGGPPLRLTLHGRGFFIGAAEPVIRVGDREIRDYEVLSDERTIVATLHEIPPEGAEISIAYRADARAVAPEPFTLDRLGGGPAGPIA